MTCGEDEPATIVMPRITALAHRGVRSNENRTQNGTPEAEPSTQAVRQDVLAQLLAATASGNRSETTTATSLLAARSLRPDGGTETLVRPSATESPLGSTKTPDAIAQARWHRLQQSFAWTRPTVRAAALGILAALTLAAGLWSLGRGDALTTPQAVPGKVAPKTIERTVDLTPELPATRSSQPPSHNAAPPSPPPPSIISAVESLMSGRHSDALIAYRALTVAHPGDAAYAAIADILARRVAAHCQARAEAGATPCPQH